ncbi:hypothetical protein Pelo_10393 [Pelomyxa schiedti]|nr:hypothetical protein Pelo_10393 [Pelomyxa schiedti]
MESHNSLQPRGRDPAVKRQRRAYVAEWVVKAAALTLVSRRARERRDAAQRLCHNCKSQQQHQGHQDSKSSSRHYHGQQQQHTAAVAAPKKAAPAHSQPRDCIAITSTNGHSCNTSPLHTPRSRSPITPRSSPTKTATTRGARSRRQREEAQIPEELMATDEVGREADDNAASANFGCFLGFPDTHCPATAASPISNQPNSERPPSDLQFLPEDPKKAKLEGDVVRSATREATLCRAGTATKGDNSDITTPTSNDPNPTQGKKVGQEPTSAGAPDSIECAEEEPSGQPTTESEPTALVATDATTDCISGSGVLPQKREEMYLSSAAFGQDALSSAGSAGRVLCPPSLPQQLIPLEHPPPIPNPSLSPCLPPSANLVISPNTSTLDCPPPLPTPIPSSVHDSTDQAQKSLDTTFLQALIQWQPTPEQQPLQYPQDPQKMMEMLEVEQREQQQQKIFVENQLRQLIATQQLQLLEQLLLQQQQQQQQPERPDPQDTFTIPLLQKQPEATQVQNDYGTEQQAQTLEPVRDERQANPTKQDPNMYNPCQTEPQVSEEPPKEVTKKSTRKGGKAKGESVGDNQICRKLLLQLQQTPPPPPPIPSFNPISSPLITPQEEPVQEPVQPTKSSTRRRLSGVDKSQLYCHFCGRKNTPEWRKGPEGPATLCNACGLQWAKKYRSSHTEGSLYTPGKKSSGDTISPKSKRRRTGKSSNSRNAVIQPYTTSPQTYMTSPTQTPSPQITDTTYVVVDQQTPTPPPPPSTLPPTTTKPTDPSRALRLMAEAATDLIIQHTEPTNTTSPEIGTNSPSPPATEATTSPEHSVS